MKAWSSLEQLQDLVLDVRAKRSASKRVIIKPGRRGSVGFGLQHPSPDFTFRARKPSPAAAASWAHRGLLNKQISLRNRVPLRLCLWAHTGAVLISLCWPCSAAGAIQSCSACLQRNARHSHHGTVYMVLSAAKSTSACWGQATLVQMKRQ